MALADGPYEPNDGDQAFGPLVGGTDYSAAIETANDRDWYAFYGFAQRQITIHATDHSVTSRCPDGDVFWITLRKANTDELAYHQLASNGSGRPAATVDLTYTLPRWALYYIEVKHPFGDSDSCASPDTGYTFRIDPADALGGPPPTPVRRYKVCKKVRRKHRHRHQSKYIRRCHYVYR